MKPIICDDTKTLSQIVNDLSNGLGILCECMNARVTEEANGIYEASFDVPVTAKHFSDLHVDGIVKLKANESDALQLFRIYRITKPLKGVCSVSLQHISYDLTKVAVTPFAAVGAGATMTAIQNHMVGTYPFTFNTNISNTESKYTLNVPVSGRSCLGGREGSFIDVFGGELHWDNLAVTALMHRGSDNGVRISYGKNLVDYRQEVNNSNTYNAVIGYAVRDDVTTTGDIQYATQTSSPKTMIVDFTNDFDMDEEITVAKLNAKAQNYINENDIGTPNINIDVDFIHLWQSKEYKNIASLERVSLFDTVHVFIPKLNVEAEAKVVKTIYDFVVERYTKIELGNVRANLGKVITDTVDKQIIDSASGLYGRISSQIQAQIDRATAFLTGAEGGYQVTHYHADGTPYETLWMNTDSEATATNILRINANGLGFSNDGGTTYRNAWLIDGTLNADFIGSGTITAINIVGSNIEGSNIVFGNSPNTTELRTNDAKTGALFDGNGVMQFNTKGEFLAKNIDSNSYVANQMRMRSNVLLNNVDTNQISFLNKRNDVVANEFYANATDASYDFWFYNNRPGVAKNANNHYMGATSSSYINRLYNYKFNSLTSSDGVITANNLYLASYATSNYAALRNYGESGNLANYVSFDSNYSSSPYNAAYLYNNDASASSMNFIRLYHVPNSNWNSILLRNNWISGSLANWIQLSNAGTTSDFQFYNYDSRGYSANRILMNSTESANAITITNYQRSGTDVINSKFMMNDNMLFECQNRTTFNFIGNGKQFAVINANNGICLAADGVAVDAFLAAGRVHIIAPNGLYVTDQNGLRTRQL